MGTLWQTWLRLTYIVLGKATAGKSGPGALHKDHIKAFIGAIRWPIVILDHVMSPDCTQPLDGALFAVNMRVGTATDSTYTFDEIAGRISSAGFSGIRQLQSKGMFFLVERFREKSVKKQ